MGSYSITFARSARKELQDLDSATAQRVLATIEKLADDPRPPGCKKLRGSNDLWRARVGSYRIVYQLDDAERVIDIVIVRHRRDVYR